MTKGQNVLIIEDEKKIREGYAKLLRKTGFKVTEASDGEEGLKIALKDHPDLILLDLLLPKSDGLIILKKIRLDAWGKRVPVVIITNLNSEIIINKCIMLGVYEYMVKSAWSMEDVVSKIKIELGK